MSSGVHFSSLPEPSKVGKIWQDLQDLIDDLKIELMEQEEKYAEVAAEFDSETKAGISDKEFQALRCRVSECWGRLQITRQDQFFYLKQQRRLAEGCLSRIAEQLGTLNVASMLSAIHASQTTKDYYENPIQPLFETITESPHEFTSDSCQRTSGMRVIGEKKAT